MAKEISYTLNVEQQEMVEQHLDLLSVILRKYINTNEQISGLEYDDLYQCGCLALCKAVDHLKKRWTENQRESSAKLGGKPLLCE